MYILKVSSILLCSFLSVQCVDFHIGNQKKRQMIFERFDNNCGKRNLPILFHYSGMTAEGSTMTINSTITVKRDIPAQLQLQIELERCKNKENLDTCEHFYTFQSEQFCVLLDSNSALWTPLFSAFKPPYKCPLKKQIYRAVNATLDASAFLLFPMDSWYWRVKIQIHEKGTNVLLMCLKAEAHTTTC